jgi:polyhydroxyalkanoate synthesis regulator phasin
MSDTQKVVVSLALGLIIGLAIGVGGTYYMMRGQVEQQAEEHEAQLDALQDQFGTVVSGKEAIIFSLEKDVARLEKQVTELENTVRLLEQGQETELQGYIDDLEEQVSSLQSQVSSQNATIAALEAQIEDIVEFDLMHHYQWRFEGYDGSINLSIPQALYWEYRNKPRPTDWEDWVSMCKDPDDDAYISHMANEFLSTAERKDYTDAETVNYVVTFVHKLLNTEEDIKAPWDEHPKYPIETLVDLGGDSEDTAILTATILNEMGYDVALIFFEDLRHVIVGVGPGEGIFGAYYESHGTRYFFLETTGDGWKVGEQPTIFDPQQVYVYPMKYY